MDIQRYLQHIAFDATPRVDLDTLQRLHHGHMLAVPFENLSIIYHQGIDLREQALFDKVINRRRGGFCYELNRLFAALLRQLGFTVTAVAGEVRARDGHFGPPFDHLALIVTLDRPYLVDVGFGDAFLTPLTLDDTPQPQASGTFHLEQEGDYFYLERRNGDRNSHAKTLYRFTLQPREFDEFDAMCHYHSHSPQSGFTQRLICSRPTANGRITLSDNKLIITADHQRTESTLYDEQQRRAALLRHFAIRL